MNNSTLHGAQTGSSRARNGAKTKRTVGKVLLYLFLILIAVVLLFPYGFMVNRGLMSNERILDSYMYYWTDGLHFYNYVLAFREGGYGAPLMNSLLIGLIVSVSTPLASLIAAYAFSKLEWIGKKFLFGVMMLTSLLPGIVTQVPLYVLYNNMGLTNTLFPLFLPGLFFAGAMNVFLTRQFLLGVPKEMEESAKLDGANSFIRCFYICAPLCAPILIYLAVTAFGGVWGDYLTPSMYNNSPEAPKTLAYALYEMTGREENSTHPEWIFAAATIMSLVSTALFIAFQKYLIEGIATAGIKG